MKQMAFGLGPSEKWPPGLLYKSEFITMDEERELLARFRKLDWQFVKMHGVIAKRRVIHYGVNYLYQKWAIEEAEPAPEFLTPLIAKGARVMRVGVEDVREILLSHYPPGAGIGWHRDAPMFGDTIFGISLGSACTMKFRRKAEVGFDVVKVELEPRGAYVISGEARREWQHGITSVDEERWSVTLRTLVK